MRYPKLVLAVLLTALTLTTTAALPAAAKSGSNDRDNKPEVSAAPRQQIKINSDGKVQLDGMKVTAVSPVAAGSIPLTVTTTATWGSTVFTWTIKTSNSTKFVSRPRADAASGDIRVGNLLSVQGTLDTTVSQPTVNASWIKNWTNSPKPQTFEGTLKSVAGTTKPTSLVVTVGSADHTVNLTAETAVLNHWWSWANLADFVAGHKLQIFGTLTAGSSPLGVINATVIRNLSLR
ncbi:MAG: hypothetical protein U1C53_02030 [Candidatus Veblenbacteria bacterium]|nr:hypothetical protein [Candidatus Veblenbacteria bacterium]MDZ4229894.1 hypothetical protein [Candidatus Veblenbacteria bacterium]